MPGWPWLGWGQAEDVGPRVGWVQSAHLCLPAEVVPPVIASSGVGWGGTSMGASPDHPWGCVLRCRPWGCGGQEQVSALALGPSSGLGFLLHAWWINPGVFHTSLLPQSCPGQIFLVL